MSSRYPALAGKRDKSEPAIVSALESVGATVEQLPTGKGVPDLLVGYKGENYLLEVKRKPEKGKVYGSHVKLNKKQEIWHKCWRGSVSIVRTPEEALAVIGIHTEDKT